MIRKQAEASVTIYFCLSITMVAALILTLIEAVRYEGLHTDAKEWTTFAAESLCAGYQPWLFEAYDLFVLDGSFGNNTFSLEMGEEEVEALLYDNLQWSQESGLNFYGMGVRNIKITEYTLLTDQQGKVFVSYMAERMKRHMSKEAARKILNTITKINTSDNPAINIWQLISDAKQKVVEQKNAEKPQEEIGQQRFYSGGAEEVVNPLEQIEEYEETSGWSALLPKEKNVSNKAINTDDVLLSRSLQKGTGLKEVSTGWYERILAQEYFKLLGGNFIEPNKEGVLSYGVEYLLWGENSDAKNLEKTIHQILMIRELANYLYLQTDATKQAEALSAATALVGVSVNPAIITIVKQGILAAWAYAESLLDVKALLSGGKVPLTKNAAVWQSSLTGIAAVGTKEYKGEAQGMSYENYLDVFLYSHTEKTVAYRMLDLFERKLHRQKGCENCRMDYMLTALQIEANYVGNRIFSGIFAENIEGGYAFVKEAAYVYQ